MEEAAQAFVFQGSNILLKIARVATGASVRWKRSVRMNTGRESGTGKDEERKEDEVKYQSRLFACASCGSKQETKEKQLKVNVGSRVIHCKNSGKQDRVHSNKCSCNTIWHQCPTHRVGPPFHNPRRATKRKNEGGK